jgi:hypothetical protein
MWAIFAIATCPAQAQSSSDALKESKPQEISELGVDVGKYCRRRKQFSEVFARGDHQESIEYAADGARNIRACTKHLLEEMQAVVERAKETDKRWIEFDRRLRLLIDTLQGAINEIVNPGGLVSHVSKIHARLTPKLEQIKDLYPKEAQAKHLDELKRAIAATEDAKSKLDQRARELNQQQLDVVRLRPQMAFQFTVDNSRQLLNSVQSLAESINRTTEDLRNIIEQAIPSGAGDLARN